MTSFAGAHPHKWREGDCKEPRVKMILVTESAYNEKERICARCGYVAKVGDCMVRKAGLRNRTRYRCVPCAVKIGLVEQA
jgi:hypothetical protein